MSEQFEPDEYIIYQNGSRYEIGKVKRVTEDGAFVYYSSGDTAAKTPIECMHKLSNRYVIDKTSLGGVGQCNGDYIRQMDNDRLARFLFIWQVNFISMFFQSGFTETMDAKELAEWVKGNKWACKEVEVGEDFIFDSEFNLKGEQDGSD